MSCNGTGSPGQNNYGGTRRKRTSHLPLREERLTLPKVNRAQSTRGFWGRCLIRTAGLRRGSRTHLVQALHARSRTSRAIDGAAGMAVRQEGVPASAGREAGGDPGRSSTARPSPRRCQWQCGSMPCTLDASSAGRASPPWGGGFLSSCQVCTISTYGVYCPGESMKTRTTDSTIRYLSWRWRPRAGDDSPRGKARGKTPRFHRNGTKRIGRDPSSPYSPTRGRFLAIDVSGASPISGRGNPHQGTSMPARAARLWQSDDLGQVEARVEPKRRAPLATSRRNPAPSSSGWARGERTLPKSMPARALSITDARRPAAHGPDRLSTIGRSSFPDRSNSFMCGQRTRVHRDESGVYKRRGGKSGPRASFESAHRRGGLVMELAIQHPDARCGSACAQVGDPEPSPDRQERCLQVVDAARTVRSRRWLPPTVTGRIALDIAA